MKNEPIWWLTKDGDKSCLALYERHYSAYRYRDGRPRYQFVGPGQKLVLRTARADAFFVWRNFIDDSGQTGINCAAFRNEGPIPSSELVRQADAIADHCWPGARHYTYVDPKAIRSSNPGYCFLKAGWSRCGKTKGGLIVMERKIVVMDQETRELGKRIVTDYEEAVYLLTEWYAVSAKGIDASLQYNTRQFLDRCLKLKT